MAILIHDNTSVYLKYLTLKSKKLPFGVINLFIHLNLQCRSSLAHFSTVGILYVQEVVTHFLQELPI